MPQFINKSNGLVTCIGDICNKRYEGVHCLTSSSLPIHHLLPYLYFLLLPSLIVVGVDGLFSGLLPRLRRSDEFITASPHHNPHNYIITTPSGVGAVWSVVRICAREGGVVMVGCLGRGWFGLQQHTSTSQHPL